MPQAALQGRRVEAGAVVAQGEEQLVAARHDGQGEGIVGLLDHLDLGDPAAERAGADRRLRVVLEDQHAVEERRPASHRADPLDAHERRRLVLAELGLSGLEAGEPGRDGRLVRQADPCRQGVDEEPQHRLDARQLRRPSRDGGAEEHVALAARAAEEDRPGTLGEGVQGEPAGADGGRSAAVSAAERRSSAMAGSGAVSRAGAGRSAASGVGAVEPTPKPAR